MSEPKSKVKAKAFVSCQLDTSGCRIEDIGMLIQRRAYELYESRGKQPGHAQEDWLQAESELKNHLSLNNTEG